MCCARALLANAWYVLIALWNDFVRLFNWLMATFTMTHMMIVNHGLNRRYLTFSRVWRLLGGGAAFLAVNPVSEHVHIMLRGVQDAFRT